MNYKFQSFHGKRDTQNTERISGFTVIEMLVVITVISILAGILLPSLGTAQKRAKMTRTQGIIDSITMALKQYRTDYVAYPPDSDIPTISSGTPTTATCVYYYSAATFIAGENSNNISAGPYMEYRQKDKEITTQQADMDGDGTSDDTLFEIVDAWGNPLIFDSTSPPNNTNSFDLYSYGPDGSDDNGNDDDIKNW